MTKRLQKSESELKRIFFIKSLARWHQSFQEGKEVPSSYQHFLYNRLCFFYVVIQSWSQGGKAQSSYGSERKAVGALGLLLAFHYL